MRIKTNMVKLLAVLAILGSLVAIAAVPVSAQTATFTSSGPVGSPVTITATGFLGNVTLYTYWDNTLISTVPSTVVATGGSAVYGILVPAASSGVHQIKVTDTISSFTGNFTVVPKVTITLPASKSGPVGSTVTIQGTGFTASVGGYVYMDTGNATLGNLTLAQVPLTDLTGSFTVSGIVPPITSGPHAVWAKDLQGANTGVNTDTFTVTPSIAVSPTSGLAGATVAIAGSGWTAGNVTLTFAGAPWPTVSADSSGAIATSLETPSAALVGVNQIVATQGTSTAVATFTVVSRALTLTPSSGPRGTTVLLTGSNMSALPNNKILLGSLMFGAFGWNTGVSPEPGNISIDTTGVISPTNLVVLPAFIAGANTVAATDAFGVIATATFTITTPTIAINPTTGATGSIMVVTGSGWAPSKVVTISLDGATAQTVVPDGNGTIAATITIPAAAKAGAHTVTAADANSNTSPAVTFTVPGAAIAVTPNQGVATTTVQLSGAGFRAYFPMTISIGGYTMTSQALTDATGAFTYTFNVPGLQPGVQVILATDGTSTATTFFTITAAPVNVANQVTGISPVLVRVWGYYGGQWQLYDPADVAGSDLATMTPGRGYWINVSADATLIYQQYSYPLASGWNLIGWR